MNSGYIPEALLARLYGTDPEAIALTGGPRLLRDITASLRVQLEPMAGFDEVFQTIASRAPGTLGLILVMDQAKVSAHVMVIVNFDGEPTIIDSQSWGPKYQSGTLTTPAEAEARYGSAVVVKLGIIPPPLAVS